MDLAIVVPNLNGSRFLDTCLASLAANQPHVRWYLQDSESTDESLEIARKHVDTRDKIQIEKDEGQADGLNRAFEKCGGDVLGWLNSDDEMAPGAGETIRRFFDANPEIDILYGGVEWIDARGEVTGQHHGKIDNLGDILDLHGRWWKGHQWVQPEVFFRRSLWEKAGPLRKDLDLAFDYDFWIKCFLAGAKAASTEDVLVRFRLHEDQKSNDSTSASEELREILQSYLNRPDLPLKGFRRRMIESRLEYDHWQRGECRDHALGRLPFKEALKRRPLWLLDSWVQKRVFTSLCSRKAS